LEFIVKSHAKFWLPALIFLGAVCFSGLALSADAPVAVVNGVAISARLMDRNVQANVAQGQKDSPELRAALRQELVARELMTQEAQKRGLDKLPATQDALMAMRQNLLIELVLNDEFTKNPITDAELKTEYERQVKALRAAGEMQQYQISTIVLSSEADARAVMTAVRAGQAFDALAKARSMDPSKDKGGDLGWFLPDQIAPAISNVVVNLAPGAVSAAPIQVGPYWHVVRLNAKRPFQVPGFEESKALVQAAVVQSRRVALLKRLSDAAVVK
jgi:peptidyl-prolyl cis-trans isomerase C